MIDKSIREVAKRINNSHYGFSIDRIVLYGSYARGTQRDSSDIDLAIFLDEDSPYPLLDDEGCPAGIFDFIRQIPSSKRIHAVVYKQEEIKNQDEVIMNISKEGIILKKGYNRRIALH